MHNMYLTVDGVKSAVSLINKDKIMKMDAGYDKMNIIFRIFCVYDEPSADLCLHKDLHLANVHYLAVKRDGVQSIQIEQESACSII